MVHLIEILNEKLKGKSFLYKSKWGSCVCEVAEISTTHQIENIEDSHVMVTSINIKSKNGNFYNMSRDEIHFLN